MAPIFIPFPRGGITPAYGLGLCLGAVLVYGYSKYEAKHNIGSQMHGLSDQELRDMLAEIRRDTAKMKKDVEDTKKLVGEWKR